MRALITPRQASEKWEQLCASRRPEVVQNMRERFIGALRDCVLARLRETEALDRPGAWLSRMGGEPSPQKRRVFIACGPGGNGEDGRMLAQALREGGDVECVVVPVASQADTPAAAPDIWVDAICGTGLDRAPEGDVAALIERIDADRSIGSYVLSVDLPSGLDGDTGRASRPCVHADRTVAWLCEKLGMYLADGLDVCGEIDVPDIEVPDIDFHPKDYYIGAPRLMTLEYARFFLPDRPRNFHKGNGGHLLVVAGSVGMAGAAAICALSALRSGVGLVTVACPASIVPIVQTLAPCAMAVPLPEADGAIAPQAVNVLRKALAGKQAVACGCGLSTRAAPEAVRAVLDCGLPAVLDADALNLIARNPELKSMLTSNHLITPHPGEAARLLGREITDAVADAVALRALGCEVILKGTSSVIPCDGVTWISASGCSGMAKGGSGDVLTGLVGGLIAQYAADSRPMNLSVLTLCAGIASELHGVAGELARDRRGNRGMCAMDIVDALPEALGKDA